MKFKIELNDATIDFLVHAIRFHAEDVIRQLTQPRRDEMAGVEEFLKSLVERAEEFESTTTQGKEDVSPQEQTMRGEGMVNAYAPYGLKNDGTPAKRRGRPSTKKAKA